MIEKDKKMSTVMPMRPTNQIMTYANQTEVNLFVGRLMQDHIGVKNSIDLRELFNKVWGHYFSDLDIKDIGRFGILSRSISQLRMNSNRFIVSMNTESGRAYYIPENDMDILPYMKRANNTLSRTRLAMNKCEKSIAEGWNSQPFSYHKEVSSRVNRKITELT